MASKQFNTPLCRQTAVSWATRAWPGPLHDLQEDLRQLASALGADTGLATALQEAEAQAEHRFCLARVEQLVSGGDVVPVWTPDLSPLVVAPQDATVVQVPS